MSGHLLQGRAVGFLYPHGNFSTECPNGSLWIWNAFFECAIDARDIASVILGLLSIVCFMCASLPQCYSSCKKGNMDQAISIWFLIGWLGGDSCNLIGSFLANQLPIQSFTAVYYILADIGMLSLYIYHRCKRKQISYSTKINFACIVTLLGISSTTSLLSRLAPQNFDAGEFKGRALLSTQTDGTKNEDFSTSEIVGFTIGCISGLFYLASRGPQIYTNFKRKSTEGLSISLFCLAMLGNTSYGLSILLKNPERGQNEGNFVIHHIPWIIGSLGVLSLDCFISFQFFIYRKRKTVYVEEQVPILSGSL
ncbi:lysosomal amino acid transporter 1 homolog [Protopterus annectens]|uniref:lysosomal amino acid transporter 1 homolog n=1 Tax=Protopterus annectens TaxID=7888 RepID=UPI001CFAF378|nr:lysosomal amino acid transporter 1 homolog [Protopterus annectens]XP_043917721.1 lysosomal amino acid transporter 1 homolog [Protopterus annectens]